MTRNEIISANSRAVVGSSSFTIGVEGGYQLRRLTSKITASPRTYSDWEDFTGLQTRGQHSQQFDPERNEFSRVATGFVRCPDDAPSPILTQGDQIKDADGMTWAILGVSSSGPGTVLYAYGREDILLGDALRGGGL